MALTTGQAVAGSQFADAMKEFYLDPVNDNVTRFSVLLDRLEKNGEDVSGNYAHLPIIKTRNPGVGSRVDTNGTGPSLPTAGSQAYTKATFPMIYHYGRGAISGPVMRASKNTAGAFAQALDLEMQGLSRRLPEDLNRQLWSYGHGRAGTLNANNAAGTTITFSAKAVFSMKAGDRIHFADITSGALVGNPVTVSSVAFDTASNVHTVTLSATSGSAVTIDVTACYFGSGASEDTSRATEMYGIPSVVDDGDIGADEGLGGPTTPAEVGEFVTGNINYGGISRTTDPFWSASVLHGPTPGTNRAMTVTLMEQAFLNSLVVGGTKDSDMDIYSGAGLWSTFGILHIADRVFNDFKETLEGGWVALKFNGRPYFFDRDAPRDSIYFLDMSSLVLLTQSGYEFLDEDGGVLRAISGKDAWEFTLFRDIQLGNRNGSRHTRLADITSTFNVESGV